MRSWQDLLQFMQTTPPADLYFRLLPGIIWKTKKVAVAPGFVVSLPTAAAPRTPNCAPHCTEGADSAVKLRTLFHLLIHDHDIMQLPHFYKKI